MAYQDAAPQFGVPTMAYQGAAQQFGVPAMAYEGAAQQFGVPTVAQQFGLCPPPGLPEPLALQVVFMVIPTGVGPLQMPEGAAAGVAERMAVNLFSVSGERIDCDFRVESQDTVYGLKQLLAGPTDLPPDRQKLIPEGSNTVLEDEQTWEATGLFEGSGSINLQLVLMQATAMENHFFNGQAAKEKWLTELKPETEICSSICCGSGKHAKTKEDMDMSGGVNLIFQNEFYNRLETQCGIAMSKRLANESGDVFDEYDKNRNGSLDPDEIEALLFDLIEVEKKHVHRTVDLDQDAAMNMYMRLLRSMARERHMASGLSPAKVEEKVKSEVDEKWPKQEKLLAQKQVMITSRLSVLKMIWERKDEYIVSMVRQMDRNSDGKVDRKEFVEHYCQALVTHCSPGCSLRPYKFGLQPWNQGQRVRN